MSYPENSFSNTFATTDITDTGLYLLPSVLLSPLCMWDKHATFKSSGKMLVSIDLFKITVRDIAIMSASGGLRAAGPVG